MRILIIGSIPDHVPNIGQTLLPEHEALFAAGRSLGYALAEAGHIVMAGSTSERTIDFHVIQGVIAFCTQNPKAERSLEIHRPESGERPMPNGPANLKISRHPYHADPSSPHKWIVAHVRAVDLADVVVTMGGSVSTRLVGNLAADRGKAIVAVPSFGGASKELYDRMRSVYRRVHPTEGSTGTDLTSWDKDTPGKILALAEDLFKADGRPSKHTYFLSYSWKNCAEVDHIETLLRRNQRPLLRDELEIKAGKELPPAIKALIEESDTFLALCSPEYETSAWCPAELEHASRLQATKGKPSRVIRLYLEFSPHFPPPPRSFGKKERPGRNANCPSRISLEVKPRLVRPNMTPNFTTTPILAAASMSCSGHLDGSWSADFSPRAWEPTFADRGTR